MLDDDDENVDLLKEKEKSDNIEEFYQKEDIDNLKN